MLTGPYQSLYARLRARFPEDRLIHDELRTLACGTDASFYRLIPRLVVKLNDEQDVIALLRSCGTLHLPLTFRAAGTSLSGQAISDSVLAMLGEGWTGRTVRDNGKRISLQPGVIGANANAILAPYGRKIGPDPASINSAMIGGIAANNASGMCCGTAQNSYQTLASMRIILADGALLDTGDAPSRGAFAQTHAGLLQRISDLALRVRSHPSLASRIRHKYRMKNTTGYGLNALVDFTDPFDIVQHLMIGSEGTLGFIAEITYQTVPELPSKASALMVFPDIRVACEAVPRLKSVSVDAVELMDRASLHSVEGKTGMPSFLTALPEGAAALLVETRAADGNLLREQMAALRTSVADLSLAHPFSFTDAVSEYTTLWNVRKGLFPSVGALRKSGTTVIIEDVAFPLERLADAALDLQTLFRKHSYHEAIIFGHALEGNLHFVFTQDFNLGTEVDRYRWFIDDVTRMVVDRYDGSLKAEHGTGRNMAPFVEREWGAEAVLLMREIKSLFDPGGILNPGVILNDDRQAHLKDLKPLPPADPLVDKCIECGFCEVHCPSRALTLTPRQRIVVHREIHRLRAAGEEAPRQRSLADAFDYSGNQTCATDGLCATACPVGIDTGALIKQLRHRAASPTAVSVSRFVASHMRAVTALLRTALAAVHVAHRIIGTPRMAAIASAMHRWTRGAVPLWNHAMPRSAGRLRRPQHLNTDRPAIVYFPTCINRVMGPSTSAAREPSLTSVLIGLAEKAGYRVIIPDDVQELCCGMAFASKGFTAAGAAKARQLEEALREASAGGRHPIVTDMSPCLYRMREVFGNSLRVYEPVRFALEYLVPRLTTYRRQATVAVHTTCSSEKMGLADDLRALACLCAEHVIVPEGVGCCGWAGDRGFTYPELNASALRSLANALPPDCTEGYSTSRTCEIGLSLHAGIPYRSILQLLDECTTGTAGGT